MLLVLTVSAFNALGQTNTDLINALNQHIVPITLMPADTNFADLEKLKPFLKDKQVFGLGEATHGTHEFFAFKDRMLRFLVKEMGVRTLVIEGDFAGTQIMNNYILYGKGDIKKGLQGIGFGIWMTQEVVDMVNWLKTYNAAQSPENKVSFFGCDIQWGSAAMQALKDYLAPLNLFSPAMEKGYLATQKFVPALTKQEKAEIRTAIAELAGISFANTDPATAAMYKHDIRALQQFADYMDANSTFFPAKQSDLRDLYMAENCEWVYNFTGRKKMMIWAHNGHINKSSGSDGLKRMGMHLSKTWNEAYYAMGFDYYNGTMRSFNMLLRKNIAVELPPSRAKSTGDVFSQCRVPNFILDVKSASASSVIGQYLNSKTESGFYGASYTAGQLPHYVQHKLADTYDAIIFIKETSAAKDMISLK